VLLHCPLKPLQATLAIAIVKHDIRNGLAMLAI